MLTPPLGLAPRPLGNPGSATAMFCNFFKILAEILDLKMCLLTLKGEVIHKTDHQIF